MTWRFEIYETLASTSDLCRERAEAGASEGLVILAHQQSAGRGSRGRHWSGGAGNLAFSFLLGFPGHSSEHNDFLQALPFMAGLALYEASQKFISKISKDTANTESPFCLKWPNDLLLNHRKMAGILVETGEALGRRWAVIGIGANLARAPEIEGRSLACLAELGITVAPEIYGRAILADFEKWRHYRTQNGNKALYRAWLARAHPPGARLTVRGTDYCMAGRFGGLTQEGCLLLEKENGDVVSVVTGEVLCV